MLTTIWTNGADASDIFLLCAVIVFAVLTVLEVLRDPATALLPAGLGLVALGLLAL